jgi:hypothetical protein
MRRASSFLRLRHATGALQHLPKASIHNAAAAAAATPPPLGNAAQQLEPIDPVAAMPDELVDQFQQDGAVVLRDVFSPEWVEAMRETAEANMSAPGPLCDEHAEAQGTAGRFHDDQ